MFRLEECLDWGSVEIGGVFSLGECLDLGSVHCVSFEIGVVLSLWSCLYCGYCFDFVGVLILGAGLRFF